MISISAVIITLNEERNIERCIRSLQGVADEIIVVDSFSTDRTEEICLALGATFINHKFDGHIEQKNRAVMQAKFSHILSLDADEALSDELKLSILKAKNNWKYDGYYMNRLTNYCGKWIHHCGWYPDRKLRLYDSRKGKWGGVNPHDKLELASGDKNTGRLKGDLLHYSYYTTEDHFKQVEYFSDISAREYFRLGKKSGLLRRWLSPPVKFFQSYFFKLGFLDGYSGLVICVISSYATFRKYQKLHRLEKMPRLP